MPCQDGNQCCSCLTHPRTAPPHHATNQTANTIHSTATANVVFIVTDISYPTESDFSIEKGIANIDSVHSTKEAANERAKKVIHDVSTCNVDIDKIIEQVRNGMYTGIGIGGEDKTIDGHCFARKCEVESWTVDVDEDKESDRAGSVDVDVAGSVEGDVDMG